MGHASRNFRRDPVRYVLSMFWYGQDREISDHAGEVCQCFSPSVFGMGKNAGTGAMTRSEYRSFVRGLRSRHIESFVTKAVGVLAALFAIRIGTEAVTQLAALGMKVEAFLRLACAIAMAVFAVYCFTCPGVRRDKLRAELLRAGRCASCAFDLTALPPASDGFVRCPECSARWRATPQASTA